MYMDTNRVWTITDLALSAIDNHLARPAPERGAALVGPAGARLVTGIVPDPIPGHRADYWHSDDLRAALSATLARRAGLTYKGTAHSHPGGMAQPSQPDAKAFRSTILANPQLTDLLFPIVVGLGERQLAGHYQGEHIVTLENGCLAPFSAYVSGRSASVFRVPVNVLPALGTAETIANQAGWQVGGVDWVRGASGDVWVMLTWSDEEVSSEGPVATVLLPTAYPLAAPLVRARGHAAFTSPEWDPGADHAGQVLQALNPRSTLSTSGEDDEMLARLAHHLPTRGDWHVAILGAGSVGSTIAEALVRNGVKSLTVVDHDLVELANLSRTVYDRCDVGKAKVEALAGRIHAIRPDAEVHAIHSDIDGWLAARPDGDALDGIDLVVLATDDMVAELAVNARCYPRSIPMVSAKLFAKADAGEIIFIEPNASTPCLQCLTGSRGAPEGRSVDYGSGQLVAELALGPDIAGVALRAVKVILALLGSRLGEGPLTDWIRPMLDHGRTMLLTSNVADWGIFGVLDLASLGMGGPYQGLWVRLQPDETTQACPVCGPASEDQGVQSADALDFALPVPEQEGVKLPTAVNRQTDVERLSV